jgi:hypothetical protein
MGLCDQEQTGVNKPLTNPTSPRLFHYRSLQQEAGGVTVGIVVYVDPTLPGHVVQRVNHIVENHGLVLIVEQFFVVSVGFGHALYQQGYTAAENLTLGHNGGVLFGGSAGGRCRDGCGFQRVGLGHGDAG